MLVRENGDIMIDYTYYPLFEEDISENIAKPNYVKIYDIIFNLIAQDILTTGDVIPSENKLAGHWNVSRGTVRMAMRKLEEDGYIIKTQGKQAVVATFADKTKEGLHWLYNLSIENCLESIDKIEIGITYQPCGVYIAHEMGYEKPGFLVLSVGADYYANNQHMANTATIFDANYIDEYNLGMNDEESIKQFVVKDIYQYAKRSKTVFNILAADEDTLIKDMKLGEPVIISEEVLLGENEKKLAYCKHRLRANKYRFSMERKLQM